MMMQDAPELLEQQHLQQPPQQQIQLQDPGHLELQQTQEMLQPMQQGMEEQQLHDAPPPLLQDSAATQDDVPMEDKQAAGVSTLAPSSSNNMYSRDVACWLFVNCELQPSFFSSFQSTNGCLCRIADWP
jgi:hypothetical protein